jgi:hypothetical protein
MTTQIVCTYTMAIASGLSSLLDRLQNAPLDKDFLARLGLGLTSDATTQSGTALTRTITLFSVPGTSATAAPVLVAGDAAGAPIASVTVTESGGNYVRPPIIAAVQNVGSVAPVRNAKLLAQLGVGSVAVSAGGAGYTDTATLTASGGDLAYGGTQATFTVNVLDGGISSITVVTPGGPYNDLNQLVLTLGGSPGTGAVLVPSLKLAGVQVVDGGRGYYAGATITITPYFKSLFPDAIGAVSQASSVQDFMTTILEQATLAGIESTAVAS